MMLTRMKLLTSGCPLVAARFFPCRQTSEVNEGMAMVKETLVLTLQYLRILGLVMRFACA